jgi:putative addiction module killer protein
MRALREFVAAFSPYGMIADRGSLGIMKPVEMGNPGDTRGVGHGILEMRIDYGPGYRIYYVHRGAQIVILLCGGDKRTQPKTL